MGKNILDGVAKDSYCPAKNRSSIHVHVVQTLSDVFWSGDHSAAASGSGKQIATAAISAHAETNNALIGRALGKKHSTCAITKEWESFDIFGV